MVKNSPNKNIEHIFFKRLLTFLSIGAIDETYNKLFL